MLIRLLASGRRFRERGVLSLTAAADIYATNYSQHFIPTRNGDGFTELGIEGPTRIFPHLARQRGIARKLR